MIMVPVWKDYVHHREVTYCTYNSPVTEKARGRQRQVVQKPRRTEIRQRQMHAKAERREEERDRSIQKPRGEKAGRDIHAKAERREGRQMPSNRFVYSVYPFLRHPSHF